MRKTIVLPLVAAFVLAGCGGGNDDPAATEGSDTAAGSPVVAKGDAIKVNPGLYRLSTEILEITIPGMPADIAKQTANSMAASTSVTQCITEAEAEQATKDMVGKQGQTPGGSCSFKKYEVSGSSIDTEMTCSGAQGESGTIKTKGTIGPNGMDVVAEAEFPGMKTKTRVKTERVGDCPA